MGYLVTQSCQPPELLVKGDFPAYGIHGLTILEDGKLLVGSVVGQSIYEVDRSSGKWTVYQGPPVGEADDIEQGPDGTLAWTSFLQGKVMAAKPGETPRVIAEGLPGANSLAFNSEGRLFMTRVFLADELYELDITGVQPPKLLNSGMGGLNGFDFGPDGKLYGPLWFRGKIVRLDVDRPEVIEDVARVRGIPAAVNFDSDGRLFAVDTRFGELLEVLIDQGTTRLVAQLNPALDNLAVDPKSGAIYVSNMSENSITEVLPSTGEQRKLIENSFAAVGDLASLENGVMVADVFGVRAVDTTGQVEVIARVFGDPIEYPIHLGTDGNRVLLTGYTSGAVMMTNTSGGLLGLLHGREVPHDGLPVAPAGAIWLEYASGQILRSDFDNLGAAYVWVDGLITPSSIIADKRADGGFWVTEYMTGKLLHVNKSGRVRTEAEGFSQLEGVAADAQAVYLAESPGRVTRLDLATGERQLLLEQDLDAPLQPAGHPVGLPIGLALLPDGQHLAVSSNKEVAIYTIPVGHSVAR